MWTLFVSYFKQTIYVQSSQEIFNWPYFKDFNFWYALMILSYILKFPRGSGGKESAYNTGDQGSTPGSGRSPGKGNGNPLQRSCLEKSMGRGSWQATVHTMHGGLIDTSKWLTHTWNYMTSEFALKEPSKETSGDEKTDHQLITTESE